MTRGASLFSPLLPLLLLLEPACSRDAPRRAEPVEASAPQASVAPPAASQAPPAPLAVPSPPQDAAAPRATPTPTAAPRADLRLLDPGREPRRALRYAFRADRRERMAIELRTSVSAETGGARQDVPLPAMNIGIALEPVSVSPAGDLHLAWRVVSAGTAVDASAPAHLAAGWSAQLGPVAHLTGSADVSSRGLSKGVSIDPGSAGEAGPDAEMVVQIVQMLRDVAAPLPEEAVGKGARWQKLSSLDARNGRATQTDTFTLLELEGDHGSLGDVFAQTASPQALPAPAGDPGGSPARVDSLLTSGDARVTFDLGRLVPQTTLEGTTSMALSAPASRMNMVMRLGITVRGELVKP